jgi:hypothetical protein
MFEQKQWFKENRSYGSFFIITQGGGLIRVFYNCWDIGGATEKNLVSEIQLSESQSEIEMQSMIDDLYKKCAAYRDESI